MRATLKLAAAAAILALPSAAMAQAGAATGAATGAITGAVVGGPIGAAAGAVIGGVAGGIAEDQRPQFRQYVVQEKRPSYAYREQVRVGARLPDTGVTYYEVPSQYKVSKYKYTVVNERPVLVDPQTHTIVEVFD